MKSWSEACAAVIPCLNEANGIFVLVREVLQQVSTVIVIDDGSHDATGEEARKAGAVVLRNDAPRGKGAALNRGFAEAAERGFSFALAMDGDGQHAPGDIPKFRRAFDENAGDLVVGNRMADPRGMPAIRQVVNRWMSARLSAWCGLHFPDSQCGFRLVNLAAWRNFRFRAEHFEIESELLVRFAMAGCRIEFVPVSTRYGNEVSRIRPLPDTLRWLRWQRQMRAEFADRNLPQKRAVREDYGSIVRDAAA